MAKRKLKSKAVTIAPGKRYYGPPELRPSTKYKRGGKLAQHLEKGGTLRGDTTRQTKEGKPIFEGIKQGHKKFIDIERAKFQMAKETRAKTELPEDRIARAERLEAGVPTQEPVKPLKEEIQPGLKPELEDKPEEKKSWYERTFPQPTLTPEETQTINQERYERLSPLGKIKYQAETIGMAASMGGQLGYLLRLGTTSAQIGLAKSAAHKATIKAANQYITDVFKGASTEQFGNIDIALNAASKIVANPKTATLFRNIMIGAGISVVTAAYVFKEIYGSKAFAGFIGKEEALQAANMGFRTAMEADDPVGAQNAIDQGIKIATAVETIQDKTPYINTLEGVDDFVETEKIVLTNQQTLLDNYLAGTDKWSKIKKEMQGDERW